jgi:major membrane immunogen (membrane-anchored lipoprotein)
VVLLRAGEKTMRKHLLLWAAAMVLLASVTAMAADVTGKWKAEFQTPDGQTRSNTFNFKVDGEKLTGTVAGAQDETAIKDGKVKGDDISFSAERPFGMFTYKGKVSGDEIKFAVEFNGQSFDITAKRLPK